MAYSVPDLPYDYNALEPHVDEQTMRIHHAKHHQAYVDKANAALDGTEWADSDVDDVLPQCARNCVMNPCSWAGSTASGASESATASAV